MINGELSKAINDHLRDAGFLSADAAAEFVRSANTSRDEFMLALLDVLREKALAPVSNFSVGAVAVNAAGAMFPGVNLEFPGLSLMYAVHAEQAVVMNALVNSLEGSQPLEALAVSAAPCGFCRQFLYELNSATRLRLLIPNREPRALTEFLPEAFGPEALGNSKRLMSSGENESHWKPRAAQGSLSYEAGKAALVSYAPYSGSRAGVALKLTSGRVFRGAYIENAAFNPSISPMAGAMSNLRVAGYGFEEIQEAFLMEAAGGISQKDVCAAILASVSKVELVTGHSD